MTEIKDLKKGNQFMFNGIIYTVKIKYRSDNRPLIATYGIYKEQMFHHEGLVVEKVQ